MTSLKQKIGYLPEVSHVEKYNLLQKGRFYLARLLRYLDHPQLSEENKPFVFGIGLSKTGTTSLAEALNILGYKCDHWHYCKDILRYENDRLLVNCNKLLGPFNAYTDTPVARVYQLLDSAFPGSKFVLTVRDEHSWFESLLKWKGDKGDRHSTKGISDFLHQDLYGSAVPDRDTNIAAFCQYNDSVREHFKDRPGDLLVMNITTGDGWETLCPFLGETVPEVPFPKKNVSVGEQ